MERTRNGTQVIQTPKGNTRYYVQDGDEVNFTGWAGKKDDPQMAGRRIGFGNCDGIILPAKPL